MPAERNTARKPFYPYAAFRCDECARSWAGELPQLYEDWPRCPGCGEVGYLLEPLACEECLSPHLWGCKAPRGDGLVCPCRDCGNEFVIVVSEPRA